MTQAQQTKALQFFAKNSQKCLCCGSNSLSIDGRLFAIFPVSELNNFRDDINADYVEKIIQSCDDCGYIMYFSAGTVLK